MINLKNKTSLFTLKKIFSLFFILLLFSFYFNISNANNKKEFVQHKNVSLEIISSVNSIGNEDKIYLGLRYKLNPGWKIYWKYPGKAGYPPEINWSKSTNIKDLEIIWPKPEKFEILGMESFGYSKEVILPINTILNKSNNKLLVDFNIDYLTCKKICVPFSDNLILKIPIGDGEKSKNNKHIMRYVDKSDYANYSNFLNTESLLFFLFVAFIGGIILNFMPCVFPVLSLKIYNILSQLHNASYKNIKRNLLATIMGIIFSFFILAFFAIILKNLGNTLGWGFQFQSPFFLILMIFILVMFSLNLLNLFKFDIPYFLKTFLNTFFSFNKKNSEFVQNFFLGFFITILSTPCSAPFIGTAVGFALISPNEIIFLIFLFISLGLSTPYILLATKPQILLLLPKPGLWMEKLKYFLSFLLILTAIWLFNVLLVQTGNINSKINDNWMKFDSNKINELVTKDNRIVFVDITADWCVTCYFNKKTVLDRKKIKEVFKEYNVQKMQGDLTKPNKEINEYINSFGRFGIPVNVVYSNSVPQGILLSEVLTVKDLLSTFESIKND